MRVAYETFCDSDVDDSSTFDMRFAKYLVEMAANFAGLAEPVRAGKSRVVV